MAYLFPHTALTPWLKETLLDLFNKLTVLQPVTDAEDYSQEPSESNHRLIFQCPFETGHKQVNQMVSAYTKWAEEHGGSDLQQVKSQLDSPLFFDEESSYRLESLIRPSDTNIQSGKGFDLEQELFSSRVFLSLSQALDICNWEVEANLDQVKASEARLFAQLHGNQLEPDDDQVPLENDPQDSYMGRERTSAWSSFLTQFNVTPNVFVTFYPEIKSILKESVPAEDLFISEGWAVISDDPSVQSKWRETFSTILDHWLLDPAKDQDLSDLLVDQEPEDQKNIYLTVHRINQRNPIQWLGGPEQMWNQSDKINSVVVQVQ